MNEHVTKTSEFSLTFIEASYTSKTHKNWQGIVTIMMGFVALGQWPSFIHGRKHYMRNN